MKSMKFSDDEILEAGAHLYGMPARDRMPDPG